MNGLPDYLLTFLIKMHFRRELREAEEDRRGFDLAKVMNLICHARLASVRDPRPPYKLTREGRVLVDMLLDRYRKQKSAEGNAKPETTAVVDVTEGQRFKPEDVPPQFREGGKPNGEPLTAPYLKRSINWLLNGPYLSKHYGPDKQLTTHIMVGKRKAYLYTELLVLRDHKLANEADERRVRQPFRSPEILKIFRPRKQVFAGVLYAPVEIFAENVFHPTHARKIARIGTK